ncbi:hypothetical protein QCE63_00295 [Caballeronia sp. LZ065]|uniref:hypothetical protein n=1 Tax=Caballeronia sp. LZ065 TaxID=3038571 RepID=UPI0028617291|nr:hypothetical protein [Caballeronia sp. LZ065]MDR5777865.1 hypothetical protein [Caballeronia sp. LZ065]
MIESNSLFDLFADASTFTDGLNAKAWVSFEGKPLHKELNGRIQVARVERGSIDRTAGKIATSDYTGYGSHRRLLP